MLYALRTIADVGAAVREARVGVGMTQAELCMRAGMSRQALSALENGRANAELNTLLSLARALNLALQLAPAPVAELTGHDKNLRLTGLQTSLAERGVKGMTLKQAADLAARNVRSGMKTGPFDKSKP